jgi:hypothetical protein
MPRSSSLFAAASLLAVIVLGSSAHAQDGAPPPGYGAPPPPGYYPPPPPPPPPGLHRDGFVIGFSIGGGSLTFSDDVGTESDSLGGPAFDLHLGAMLMPNLAILGDGWGVGHAEDFYTITVAMWTVAARFFFANRFWVQGGLGFGQATVQFDNGFEDRSDSGVAGTVAFGVEVLQTSSFALDLQLRGGYTSLGENLNASLGAFTVGFTWY